MLTKQSLLEEKILALTFSSMLYDGDINESFLNGGVLVGPYLGEDEQTILAAKKSLNGIKKMTEPLKRPAAKQNLDKILGKMGLSIHKSGSGLIDYIKQFTRGAGKMILAAIKRDKQTVKDLARSVSREELLDFLLKLDMATLHLVTGPIHVIDAITGFDLWANIKGKAEKAHGAIEAIKKAIDSLEQKIKTVVDQPKRDQMIDHLNKLKNTVTST